MSTDSLDSQPLSWPQLINEWEAAQDLPPLIPRFISTPCRDANPWDATIRCELPFGHDGMHHAEAGLFESERWDDECHWLGDNCQPCSNPRRRAA